MDRITNHGLEYLQEMPELEGLWFSRMGLVDGRGVVKLANLPKLKILWMGDISLDDSQLKELTRLKKTHSPSFRGLQGHRLGP